MCYVWLVLMWYDDGVTLCCDGDWNVMYAEVE